MKNRSIKSLSRFDREFKRLAKKYKSLNNELIEFSTSLKTNPVQGKSLGAGLYKIRLASRSKGTGKSGGFRVITYYIEQVGDDEVVYLVTIYDKSEEDSISKDDLIDLVSDGLSE